MLDELVSHWGGSEPKGPDRIFESILPLKQVGLCLIQNF